MRLFQYKFNYKMSLCIEQEQKLAQKHLQVTFLVNHMEKYYKNLKKISSDACSIKFKICFPDFVSLHHRNIPSHFHVWAKNIYLLWSLKRKQNQKMSIQFGQDQFLSVIRFSQDNFLEAIVRQINDIFEESYMGMVLSIKNQRLILYLNLKWFESKDLSNKFLKFENIVYGLGIIISQQLFPIGQTEPDFLSSFIYGRQIKSNIEGQETTKTEVMEKRLPEYNIQIFRSINKQAKYKIKDNIVRYFNVEAEVYITVSSPEENPKTVPFSRLIRKEVDQEESTLLLKHRMKIKNINIGKFYLLKIKQSKQRIEVEPLIFGEEYQTTLLQYINSKLNDCSLKTFLDLLKIFKQVLLGIKHLTDNGIIHSDLKLSNIMMSKKEKGSSYGNIKIIDFGSAVFDAHLRQKQIESLLEKAHENSKQQINKLVKSRKKYLTYFHQSISATDIYNIKFDLYSLGIILQKMFLRCRVGQNIFGFHDQILELRKLNFECRARRPTQTNLNIDDVVIRIEGVLGQMQKERQKYYKFFG